MHEPSDGEVLDAFPDLPLDHDDKDHFRGRLQRRLLINRCVDCGRWSHPPRGMCPNCWSDDVVPTEICGRGTVYLTMRLHQGPPAPGIDYGQPYPVVVVELEEQPGLRFTATTVGGGDADIRIGTPVQLTWIDRAGVSTPAFALRT